MEKAPRSAPIAAFCERTEMATITDAGGLITLRAGESITLPPRLSHAFHAVNGDALIGEVSSINDECQRQFFCKPLP